MAHANGVGDVDPVGQYDPALQLPLHIAVDNPGLPPYCPAGHWPLHVADVMPQPVPYSPTLHGEHVAAPPMLN